MSIPKDGANDDCFWVPLILCNQQKNTGLPKRGKHIFPIIHNDLHSIVETWLSTEESLDPEARFRHCVKNEPMSDLTAYIDGGSHGSPGPSGIGIVVEHPGGERLRIAKWIGHQDNNVAEYVALLEVLQHALERKATVLRVFSDSELVVKQMNGEYACNSPRLYTLNWTCRKLARFLEFYITHIPREHNREANLLANHAVRTRRRLGF